MPSITIKNLDELRRRFEEAPALVSPILGRATIDAGKLIQRREVKEMPHITGNLQRSVRFDYTPIRATIVPIANYAIYVQMGTGIYGYKGTPITPKKGKFLAFKGSDGNMHFVRSVKGQKANDFIGRTVLGTKSDINKVFTSALDEIVKAIANG